jgi:hypothetical protein
LKRLYIAIAILIILPSLIVANQFYLKGTTNKMTELLNNAENSAKQNDDDKAKQDLVEFGKEWDINNKIIATFVRHSELDSVNESKARLLPYLENNDLTSFCAECEVIKSQLHHIMHTEEFSFDNIF